MIRFALTLVLLASIVLTSACTASAEPHESGGPVAFPDMSGYTAANPDDYAQALDNPGRPEKLIKYAFDTPDGVRCSFGKPASASCGGNNLPAVSPATCDSVQGIYRYNVMSTSRGLQQWPRGSSNCSEDSPPHKVLPPFHTLTVNGVVCGVDDKGMTACKDPQGQGFVLSPSWSGWIPKV